MPFLFVNGIVVISVNGNSVFSFVKRQRRNISELRLKYCDSPKIRQIVQTPFLVI